MRSGGVSVFSSKCQNFLYFPTFLSIDSIMSFSVSIMRAACALQQFASECVLLGQLSKQQRLKIKNFEHLDCPAIGKQIQLRRIPLSFFLYHLIRIYHSRGNCPRSQDLLAMWQSGECSKNVTRRSKTHLSVQKIMRVLQTRNALISIATLPILLEFVRNAYKFQ